MPAACSPWLGRRHGRAVLAATVAGPAQRHPLAHFNLAKALATEPDPEPEKALDHYRWALAPKPDLAAAWHNLGNLLLDLDRPEEAAEPSASA